MNPLGQTARIEELMKIGKMQRRRSAHRSNAELGPLRDVLRDVPMPIWPAGDSGSQWVETLSCGHYRFCESRCTAKAHRCALCLKKEAGV